MTTFSDFAKEQYAYVQDARSVLLNYCKAIDRDDLVSENPSFGHGGSIRNLLVHIANCYQAWIANRSLERNLPRLEYNAYKNMDEITKLFIFVDQFMATFFECLNDPDKEINYEKDGIMQSATSFKMFSHVISHEFHHKGQILSMSRHLGYTPVDTDILR